ncbi:hypothetical protein LAV_00160 [Sphingobium phage Lacusarx]|uniref:Uncharacterized protein n=1 Tax=Sphingobium phage Lacusarx TaxID=1980139 RepID=A0A1W6DXA6_9CAUD|nr:hypothetical protein FDH44_gp143 [Sphingobium phage Lacusarx]ARK07535.1 hypothetical protein LAV_00160 [Sphingobium phage Lacusarx]
MTDKPRRRFRIDPPPPPPPPTPKIKTAGTLVLLSYESHSDYGIAGLYRMTADINLTEAADNARKEGVKAYDFGDYLVSTGAAESVDYDEINCGGYSRLELS